MLSNPGGFFQTALTVLTLASCAGLGLTWGTIKNLRSSLADARGEIADGDRKLAKCEATVDAQGTTITRQADAIKTLEAAVRGDAKLDDIWQRLDTHHVAAEAYWTSSEELLGLILQALTKRNES